MNIAQKDYVYSEYEIPDRIVEATKDTSYKVVPMGIFKIRVNHIEQVIEVLYIGRKGKNRLK